MPLKSLTLAILLLSSIYSCGQSHTAATEEDPNIFLSTNQFNVGAILGPVTFANLPTGASNGTVVTVSNGTPGSPCTGGGSGALAIRSGGVWVCLPTSGGGSSIALQTNGTNNISQSLLNYVSTTGITGVTSSNPSGGVEEFNLASPLLGTDSSLLTATNGGGTLGQNWCTDATGGATNNPSTCTNGGGSLSGGGTAGKLAEWTSSASLGNSPITDNGANTLTSASGYSFDIANLTTTQNPGIFANTNYIGTSSISNTYGAKIYDYFNPGNTSGNVNATNVFGMNIIAENMGAAFPGTASITNLFGEQLTVGGGSVTSQYGIQVTSQTGGSTTTNKGLDILTGNPPGLATQGFTTDYGIYIEPMSSSSNACSPQCAGTHYGLYIDDQGVNNGTSNNWYGLYIASQTQESGHTNYGLYVAGNSPTYFGGGITSAGSAFAALTDAATVTWAIGSNQFANTSLTFTVHSGSRTLNITNPVSGGQYQLILTQDSTGGEGLTLGSGCTWKVGNGGGGTVTLTGTPNAVDILSFTYSSLTSTCYANISHNFN